MPPPHDDLSAIRAEIHALRAHVERAAEAAREVGGSNHTELQLINQRLARVEADMARIASKQLRDSESLAVLTSSTRERTAVTVADTRSSWQFFGVALAALLSLIGSVLGLVLR